MPLGIPTIPTIEKGYDDKKVGAIETLKKKGGLCLAGTVQILQTCQGHKREGKMGLVTIIPFVETISYPSWTLVPLGAH